jgi:hypothetical protein
VGWHSALLIVILVFGITFALLYFASVTNTSRSVPIDVQVSEIEAINIVEQDLKAKNLNYTDARLWFSLFNYTEGKQDSQSANFAYLSEAKAHPELLNLFLIYIDPNNQTEHIIHESEGQIKVELWCLEPDANCLRDPATLEAIKGKLAYRIELVSPVQGYYYIDGTTGAILHIHLFQ